MSASNPAGRSRPHLKLSASATTSAIEELKRLGKETWGATYYSQLAPAELCTMAGRPRPVQFGALISWLKRLGENGRPAPKGAIELVAALLKSAPADEALTTEVGAPEPLAKGRAAADRSAARESRFEVNCPSVVHDYRFVVLGELPRDHLHAVVLVQPLDGTGLWYPQVARHNPLRAGRAFACFVQLGNPAGIWHIRRPPLDAKVRVLALERPWSHELNHRLSDREVGAQAESLGLVDQHETLTSRVSTDPLVPLLRDAGPFSTEPLTHPEPQPRKCVAPLIVEWNGGAAYLEVRSGDGDQLIHEGTAASGVTLTLTGRSARPTHTTVLCELPGSGRYRLRLYPAVKSFVDPPYEWWLDVS
jgi:hypothetical protein